MGQHLVTCRACGEEFMIELPAGRKFGGLFVTIGYCNAGAVHELKRAIEIVETASEDLPFRTDLAEAARLLRSVGGQLVGIANE